MRLTIGERISFDLTPEQLVEVINLIDSFPEDEYASMPSSIVSKKGGVFPFSPKEEKE